MRLQGTALAFCALFGVVIADAETGLAADPGRETPVAERSAGWRMAAAATGWSGGTEAAVDRSEGGARGARAARRAGARGQTAAYGGGGISCVPYARMVTGMQVTGNGGDWWANASGLYDRGARPEPGSVMAFRATGGMARGHVAVVSRVLGPRHVEIDHANWAGPGIRRGTVMRDVSVIDVSDRNDWSAVRVQVGWDPYTYGRVYPTYGFIYNRPDTRTMMASTGAPRRGRAAFEEVAADLPAGRGGRGAGR
jgi:CHAP domain